SPGRNRLHPAVSILQPAPRPRVSPQLRPSRLRRRCLRILLWFLPSALATSSHALRPSTRWIGFSEDDGRGIAEGANIRRQSRIIGNALKTTRSTYTRERRRPAAREYLTFRRCGSILSMPAPLFTSMIW